MKKGLILAVLTLVGCREEVQMLSATDVAALLAQDRRITFERFHISGSARIDRDGQFAVLVPRLGQDTGAWWLEEDAICSQWAAFRQGAKLCATVGRTESGGYQAFSPDTGSYLGDFQILD
ncbi:hypothetical protein [Ruegeria lacuscaerulensis]|uniref:hypothetical protein n=1 Tax=Ruegeria lacuscaerulensis TaxID=55218 RepID=UPI00147EE0DF|nr:hypothetical protein [Ruegeria lacuscaerulensis]